MTVRIKKDGNAEVVEADDACKLEAIKILDEMLEDYVGIRDKELCQERRFLIVLFLWLIWGDGTIFGESTSFGEFTKLIF